MNWRDQPATEKQINYAKSLAKRADTYHSIDWDKHYTKGEMTDLIDSLKEELGMPINTRDVKPLPGEPLPPIDPMPTGPLDPVTGASVSGKQYVAVLTVTFVAADQNQGMNKLANLLRSNGYQVHAFEVTAL